MSLRPAFSPPSLPTGHSDREICLHVVEACAEIRRITRRPRFRTVSYLLDMVRLEAERMVKELSD